MHGATCADTDAEPTQKPPNDPPRNRSPRRSGPKHRGIHDQFFCSVGASMKRQISRVIVSSMTDRRIDGAPLTRRAVKKALSDLRRLCRRLRRGAVCRDDRIERQNLVNDTGDKPRRMHLDEEELWKLSNENMENELRELVAKMRL